MACTRPTLTRLLSTTGFDRFVPVADTVEKAFAALEASPGGPSPDGPADSV